MREKSGLGGVHCGQFILVTPKSIIPCQLSEDNRHIVLPLVLMLLHSKETWHNMHAFQHGEGCKDPPMKLLSAVLQNFANGRKFFSSQFGSVDLF